MTNMTLLTIETPIGPFTLIGEGKTVLASGFTDDPTKLTVLIHRDLATELSGESAIDLEPAAEAVAAYFAGDLAALDAVEVRQQSGGNFLGHAWETLREVQPGHPISYTEFAERSGRPAAIRAAAQACARNAAALFVPCHRVVRTDGSMGGFRWGIDIKQWLLAHEQLPPETRS